MAFTEFFNEIHKMAGHNSIICEEIRVTAV